MYFQVENLRLGSNHAEDRHYQVLRCWTSKCSKNLDKADYKVMDARTKTTELCCDVLIGGESELLALKTEFCSSVSIALCRCGIRDVSIMLEYCDSSLMGDDTNL